MQYSVADFFLYPTLNVNFDERLFEKCTCFLDVRNIYQDVVMRTEFGYTELGCDRIISKEAELQILKDQPRNFGKQNILMKSTYCGQKKNEILHLIECTAENSTRTSRSQIQADILKLRAGCQGLPKGWIEYLGKQFNTAFPNIFRINRQFPEGKPPGNISLLRWRNVEDGHRQSPLDRVIANVDANSEYFLRAICEASAPMEASKTRKWDNMLHKCFRMDQYTSRWQTDAWWLLMNSESDQQEWAGFPCDILPPHAA